MKKIRSIREQQKISSIELAKKAGLPYGTIIKAELGYATPRPATLAKIAGALGVQPAELLEAPASSKEVAHA